jgi:hypothetical protein
LSRPGSFWGPYEHGMSWTAHYFDRRLNSDGVSRAFASKEDALVAACDLMRRNCVVNFVQGPNDEKIDATTITAWCKRRPKRKDAPAASSVT